MSFFFELSSWVHRFSPAETLFLTRNYFLVDELDAYIDSLPGSVPANGDRHRTLPPASRNAW